MLGRHTCSHPYAVEPSRCPPELGTVQVANWQEQGITLHPVPSCISLLLSEQQSAHFESPSAPESLPSVQQLVGDLSP